MKLFRCHYCGHLLHFENIQCERCGSALGFAPESLDLLTLVRVKENVFTTTPGKKRYKYCANTIHSVCNWLIPAERESIYCEACTLNHTIPNLTAPGHEAQWRKLEVAKHRLIYTLLKLQLPVTSKAEDPEQGLSFDFLAEEDSTQKVVMGHANGLITINLKEADDAIRIKMQEELNEPYRTLLGHFRHESGHYYWDRLIVNKKQAIAEFRAIFGDERIDYNESLKKYYHQLPATNWQNSFVSAYATSHPWEDWAETWAHYLHIMDTLETAYTYGIGIRQVSSPRAITLSSEFQQDPFNIRNFEQLIDRWIPLTLAVNSLNRSMGQPDLYPFAIGPGVVTKLTFIHDFILHENRTLLENTNEVVLRQFSNQIFRENP